MQEVLSHLSCIENIFKKINFMLKTNDHGDKTVFFPKIFLHGRQTKGQG